jgi:hypothetical protein
MIKEYQQELPEGLEHEVAHLLLAYRASTHDTMGMTTANLVFRRELHLPCDLMKTPHHKEHSTIDHAADLIYQLHDIHNYPHEHFELTSE